MTTKKDIFKTNKTGPDNDIKMMENDGKTPITRCRMTTE